MFRQLISTIRVVRVRSDRRNGWETARVPGGAQAADQGRTFAGGCSEGRHGSVKRARGDFLPSWCHVDHVIRNVQIGSSLTGLSASRV